MKDTGKFVEREESRRQGIAILLIAKVAVEVM